MQNLLSERSRVFERADPYAVSGYVNQHVGNHALRMPAHGRPEASLNHRKFASLDLCRIRYGAAVRVTSIALVRSVVSGGSSWRRRIPAALFSVGLVVLAIGAARPQATVPVASSSDTIMLTLDVSGSMCATDVKPNRIGAAEQSAEAFIKSQAVFKAAISIHPVEARHAAWIRQLAHQNPAPAAFNPSMTKSQVLAAVAGTGFVKS